MNPETTGRVYEVHTYSGLKRAIQDLVHTPEQLEKVKKSVAAMEAKEAEKRKQAALEAAAAKKAAAEKAAAEKA